MSLTATGVRKRGDAGYFRLGDVVLTIPPESILVEDVDASEEIAALRGKYTMQRKTGHARRQVTIAWKALADPTNQDPFAQWRKLQRVLAIFRAAPYVQVESGHLRQLLYDGSGSARMAFALRQLKIDTLPDIPDGLQGTLTMDLFNYAPYSIDFGYQNDDGQPDEAYLSSKFTRYIDTWVKENLDSPNDPFSGQPALAEKFGYPQMQAWDRQDPGTLTLHWREYTVVPLNGRVPPGGGSAAPAPDYQLPPSVTNSAIKQKVQQHARDIGVDPALAMGVVWTESRFNPNAFNRKSGASGLMQLVPQYHPGVNYLDPDQNLMAGLAFLKSLLKKYKGNETLALQAYNWGPGNLDEYLHGTGRSIPAETRNYAPSVLKYASNLRGILPPDAAGSPLADASPQQAQVRKESAALPAGAIQKIRALYEDGWQWDHRTDRAIFLFRENEIDLSDHEHGSAIPADGEVFPTNISAVFVNNLVMLPLSGMPYPTSQHIGPAGTLISIGLAATAAMNGDREPEYNALSEISGMTAQLRAQYHRLRGEWRAVASIHRMQAIIVENQVLNLLGIRGTMPKGFSSETVNESPGLVQGSLLLSQYENVFESIQPFRVNGPSTAYKGVVDKVLADPQMESKLKKDGVFSPLYEYRDGKKNHNPGPILKLLENSSTGFYPAVPMPVQLTAEESARVSSALKNVATPGAVAPTISSAARFQSSYPDAYKRLLSGQQNFCDWMLFVHALGSDPSVSAAVSRVAAQSNSTMDAMYDAALQWRTTNDPTMINAITQLQYVPELKDRFQSAVPGSGPGLDPWNVDHGAYKDMGLKSIETGGLDFNPAYYFVDYGRPLKDRIGQQASYAAGIMADAANTFAAKNTISNVRVETTGDTPSPDNTTGKGNTFDPQQVAKAVLDKTIVPYYSMARAFPTFKLFFCEESSEGPFYMFDNVYSYGSVLSIEVEKYADKPDLAIIQITNLANLLSHRLFDDTAAGRTEKELSNLQDLPGSDAGPVVGDVTAQISARKTGMGIVSQLGLDLSPDMGNGVESPLQYFPLQTGTKIQIRMGFANNPDKLYPVFNGRVAQLEGQELLTVVAQGFLTELTSAYPEELGYDSFANLSIFSGLLGGIAETAASPSKLWHWGDLWSTMFGRGARFGGYTATRDSGSSKSVMEIMLQASTAKHFGHWQVDPKRGTSQFLKGFNWDSIASESAKGLGMSGLAKLISGYDRSGENIMVNRYYNPDGSGRQSRLERNFQYEQPLGIFPPEYHVPDELDITPWRVIKDISRRYPQFILAPRPYGFPYTADATMVFGSPNDLYISRWPLADEAELERVDDTFSDDFRSWWGMQGKGREQFLSFAAGADGDAVWEGLVFPLSYMAALRAGVGSKLVPGNRREDLAKWIDAGGAAAFDKVMNAYAKELDARDLDAKTALGSSTALALSKYIRDGLLSLRKKVLSWIQTVRSKQQGQDTAVRPGDRLQPVRRWHLITRECIIANNLQLNENIFNAVRVNHDVMLANANIPPHHWRILDADRMIIEPVKNCRDLKLQRAYQQSFLREEVGKMYRGEIVLTGMPEIEPFDCLLLVDQDTGTSGPVEVESVVHSFDSEMGYISVVRPRALVSVNEWVTAGILAGMAMAYEQFSTLLPEVGGGTEAGRGAIMGLLLYFLADDVQKSNALLVHPLARFGKPWVGGLNGWSLNDTYTLYQNKLQRLWRFEVAPGIESFRRINQLRAVL